MNELRWGIPGLLLSLLLAACAADNQTPESASPSATPQAAYAFVPGEVLVGIELPAEASAHGAATASVVTALLPGAQVQDELVFKAPPAAAQKAKVAAAGGTAVLTVRLPAGVDVATAIERLTGQAGIRYAEPNRILRRAVNANDSYFGKQWGLVNTGQTIYGNKGTLAGIAGADIAAASAWDVRTASQVPVALLDSGLDLSHPDLAGNLWSNPNEQAGDANGDGCPGTCGVDDDGDGQTDEGHYEDDDENGYRDDLHGWNFVVPNGTPQDDDVDGHGTHGAGIVGALGNNGLGVSGIGWTAKLMPLKFLDAQGSGSTANEIAAIYYAVANGAKIINASYTYEQSCILGTPSSSERSAIDYARQHGVLFVAAAGNFGCNNDNTPFYPASHTLDNILSVAASDSRDRLASWNGSGSNYGPNSVDLAAPGHNIYSTIPTGKLGSDGVYGYSYLSGTSMAAPMVSGAAALLWSHNPTWTYAEVRDVLIASVDPVATLGGVVISGGRLNLSRALQTDVTLTAPAAPTGLQASLVAANQVNLTWTDQASNETGYIVERSIDNGTNFIAFDRIDGQVTSYVDTAVPDGRMINYRVKAMAGTRSSAYSNQLDVMVPLLPPQGPGVIAAKSGLTVVWTDASGAETSYRVERMGPGETAFIEVANLAANSTTYADPATVVGAQYRYRMRAHNPLAGYSDYSPEVTAIRPPPGKSSSGCFIATAAWGSPLSAEVESLRNFRDRVLLETVVGRLFVAAYYRISPSLAEVVAGHDALRSAARTVLYPLVWLARVVTPAEASAMGSRPAPVSEETGIVPGEILLGLRSGVAAAAAEAVVKAEGGRLLEEIKLGEKSVLRVGLPTGMTVATARERFAGHPEIEYAEANRVVSIRPPAESGGRTAPRP